MGSDDAAVFVTIAKAMMSDDQAVREPAEAKYNEIAKPMQATFLFGVAQASEIDENLRDFCLILLRRLLSTSWEETYGAWDGETQSVLKKELIADVQTVPSKSLRRRYADVIAEVARNTIDEKSGQQTWAEIVQFVPGAAMHDDVTLKTSALTIFESVPSIFGVDQSKHYAGIKEMLLKCLQHTDGDVRTQAMKAFTAFVVDNDEDEVCIKHMKELMPHVLKVVQSTIEQEDDDDAPLQCLGDIAMTVPKVLRATVMNLCEMCLATVADSNREDTFRHSALEVLVSLCESSPAMMRKTCAQALPYLVEQCLSLMCELEDDEDWYNTDTVMEEDEDDNATVGESSLDRVATALGGKTVWPLCKEKLSILLQNKTWQHRHAAIMAVSCVGEGCRKVMEGDIAAIVESILPFVADEHARVRYATCNALGQMSTDFAPTLQKKTHAKVLPALLTALSDVSCPRVAAHAGAALVNFSEECPKKILAEYLDQTMQTIVSVLEMTYKQLSEQTGKRYVLEQVITTMASVADTTEDRFTPYYDKVMPFLKHVLLNATDKDTRLLRGKTIECMSLIGLAVGSEKFMPDADEIMQVLLHAQQQLGTDQGTDEDEDDPQVSYMMSAWARICKLMGARFVPYLPMVMPFVMKAAEHTPQVSLGFDDEGTEDDDDGWQYVQLADNQKFGIQTAGLEDKRIACEMLVCYAREMGDGFADYARPVADLLKPLLKFYFDDGVRTAASECLSFLLTAMRPKGDAVVLELWNEWFEPLCTAAETDPETEVQAEHVAGIAKCIEALGMQSMDEPKLRRLAELLKKIFETHFERCDEIDKSRQEEDHDEEEEENVQRAKELQTEVVGRVSDLWHALFGKIGEPVMPYVDPLMPYVVRMLDTHRATVERQWAICLYDDLVEHAPQHAQRYLPQFLESMLHGLGSETGELRQACAYGFGIMALRADLFADTCAQACGPLVHAIQRADARTTEEGASATDNCVAALAKILKHCPSPPVEADALLPHFVNALPTHDDQEESPHIYGYFCDLVESNHPCVSSNIARVVAICVDAIRLEAFDMEEAACVTTADRVKAILHQIKASPDTLQATAATLDAEQQEALQQILQ